MRAATCSNVLGSINPCAAYCDTSSRICPASGRAARPDAGQILELVSQYAAQGLMLPRTFEQVAARIDSYVVATDSAGRVIACAALEEYSPSLAEVSSVAVAPTHHG